MKREVYRFERDELTAGWMTVLQPWEQEIAREFSEYLWKRARGRQTKHRAPGQFIEQATIGFEGEIAAAKVLGLPWIADPDFPKTEVGPYQVRTRTHFSRDQRAMLFRRRDDGDAIYVHVRQVRGKTAWGFLLAGWIRGSECRRSEWMKDPGGRGSPLWVVPERLLNPMDTLPRAEEVS